MQHLRVWDLPTRVFHWLLAASIPAALATGFIGGDLIDWHGRIALFILGLVTFRVVWGFIGSNSARFASFVRGPRAIRAYLRGEWRGVGHNPLGALSVIGMLALIGVQIGTGLFANDDIAFQGPLADLVGKERSNRLTHLHALLQYGLIAAIALHAAAIVFYVRVKRETLLRPMLTGWKAVPREHAPPAHEQHHHQFGKASGLIAFVLATSVASATVYAAAGALLEAPSPPPPAATPSW
jgi:cytochrome b